MNSCRLQISCPTRDIDDTVPELTDVDNPIGNDRDYIGTTLERDMQQGNTQKIGF